MSNKGDRVQKWGELLAELAEDAEKFDREKQDKLLAEKKKYRDFYQTIESECANFQPNKLRHKLNTSLKNNYLNSIIVFSFTCNLAKRDDYQDVVLNAVKTKAFSLGYLNILKILSQRYVRVILKSKTLNSIGLLVAFILVVVKGVMNNLGEFVWQWLAWTFIISVIFFAIDFFEAVFKSISFPNSESLISVLEKVLNEDFTKKIIISDRRNIKLPELRLLFLELDKFALQPILIIKRKTNLKVNFELQIKNSPKFKELLQ